VQSARDITRRRFAFARTRLGSVAHPVKPYKLFIPYCGRQSMKKQVRTPTGAAKKSAKPTAKAAAATPRTNRKPVQKAKSKATPKPAAVVAEPAKVRIKLVRDSFTMPREDFERIARLKSRAIDLKRPAKKSELLRAGLQTLERLDDAGLLVVLNALQSIKTGRPKKRH